MHIAIVGGGLGGLAAAALLANHATVTLYERSAHLGGRARTELHGGASVNLGPHALYAAGAGMRVLRRLGIAPVGTRPPPDGLALRGGTLHALPADVGSVWRTTALTPMEKLSLPRWLGPWGAPDVPLAEWLQGASPAIADLMRAFVRVSSYTNAPTEQSAQAATRQLALATRGVLYLDAGWQSLVDALRPTVDLRVGEDVQSLPDADAVVIAGPPSLARRLGVSVPDLTPVRAACLDLVLDGLPEPENRFVLGLDQPLYLGEHGAVARLGGTVLHVARYLATGERGADARAGLEAILDQAQPGWRHRVLFERFLPELTVTHRIDAPGLRVPGAHEVDGRPVLLVGDWVGEEGMLLDRSLASAERAADALVASKRMAA